MPGTEKWHGTTGGYTNHRCHCPRCKRAWADYQLKRRRERRNEEPPVHGTASTYGNWFCRCEACTAAHAADTYERRMSL